MISLARFFLSLGCLILMAMGLSACSSKVTGPGGAVTKVKIYHLQPTEKIKTNDPSILAERAYHLHGAVTLAEQMERAGHYYTFFWKVADRSQPVTVRFQYRQQKTGLSVKLQEVQVSDVRRSNVTKFNVTGADYQADGPVTAWKVTVLRGNEELVHSDSFLWKD